MLPPSRWVRRAATRCLEAVTRSLPADAGGGLYALGRILVFGRNRSRADSVGSYPIDDVAGNEDESGDQGGSGYEGRPDSLVGMDVHGTQGGVNSA